MLAEIEDRLRDQVTELRHVAGAAEFAALDKGPPRSLQPAAYVIALTDAAQASPTAIKVTQHVTERFGVVLALGNFRDPHGATATKQLEAVREKVRDALLGWQPAADRDEIEYAGGRIIGIRDGVVWWQSDFATAVVIQS